MEISIIVAMGKNGEIGCCGRLPWSLPRDMRHFRELTEGNAVLMGRKTYESIPKFPLKNRLNIIVSKSIKEVEGGFVFDDITGAINLAKRQGYDRLFVIGGSSIYERMLPLCDKIFQTKVYGEFPMANVFFPKIDLDKWEIVSQTDVAKDEKNAFDMSFIEYKKKI